jgi:alcohol dehydrogenase (cytochrome c)
MIKLNYCGETLFMKIKKLAFMTSAAVILIGTICAAALYWHPINWKSAVGLESVSNEKIWQSFSLRARLCVQKAKGGLPELSWTELWELMRPESGVHWIEGRSVEGSLVYSSTASEGDRAAGACIFRKRCTGCHGSDGWGGLHGPSLNRSGYKHGDSDLAIYKVLRDGVPGTAMPSAALPPRELLQIVAHVRTLQVHPSKDLKAGGSGLAVKVSSERLQADGTNPDEWLTYSGSYNGWRHSSLTEITPANVAQLRIRWIKQFDSNDPVPVIEGTPLVTGGAIFMTGPAPNVWALDAKTGDVIWAYERPMPADLPLCCGRNNRGLAVQGSTLFFGSLDGYLVALDANNGMVIWQTLVASPSDGYSITGAPLVVDHSVVVGVAGGEFGIRGFLAAYDVSTGQRQWKFQTIPGPGEAGHETWESDAWRAGGGPTWNTGSYDPSTGLLYWGVGNPSPDYSGDARPGDNLFTNSVIALHASSGKLAWYFQFTPHDEHDWDSAQTPVLADLVIGGLVRKVICWPNRNAFYYVLDRVTGEFLVGVPFVALDWAKGLTSAGRPIPADAAGVSAAGRLTKPGVGGGTNWQNPAFDPIRESIFVPATESAAIFTKLAENGAMPGQQGLVLGSGGIDVASPPPRFVLALDAATGRRKWEYLASPAALDHSGLLATAGGLVFGASAGYCFALDADTGREVWRVSLGGKTMAAPISFTVDGRQVVAVAAGRALFVFGL